MLWSVVVDLWARRWTKEGLLSHVGRLEQLAGVQLVEAGDGAERGVRLLLFRTGAGFDFEVLVDRGFDIGRARADGRPLAWWSPVGLTGPWFQNASGIEWFRGFPGGLVSTCGLDHALPAGQPAAPHHLAAARRPYLRGRHGAEHEPGRRPPT
jgi:hypothetical protein